MDQLFATAKARYVLLILFMGPVIPYVFGAVFLRVDLLSHETTFASVFLGIASNLTIFGLLWFSWCSKSTVENVFGRIDSTVHRVKYLRLGIPMVGVALFCLYLVYYPLSYIAPEFVIGWALEGPELLVPMDRANALAINISSVFLAVFVVPIVEELIFRGFLLGRFSAKYGMGVSIIITSILFAVLHPDVLGKLLIAIVLCLIRIKHDSLYAPILVHVGTNAVALILVAPNLFLLEGDYTPTLEEFRSQLWVGLIGGAIGFPWLYRYYQRELSQIKWNIKYV